MSAELFVCGELRIIADKRLRYASLKLPSATSFIRGMLAEMVRFIKGDIL